MFKCIVYNKLQYSRIKMNIQIGKGHNKNRSIFNLYGDI